MPAVASGHASSNRQSADVSAAEELRATARGLGREDAVNHGIHRVDRPAQEVECHGRQLERVIRAIAEGAISNADTERSRSLVDSLLHRDVYLLMADFADYVATQAKVDALFADRAAWAERALRNIAGMGPFSSDRTIAEYVDRVWSTKSLNS